MAQTRVAVGGLLLLLGVANVAALDFHFAPRFAAEIAAAEALSTKKPIGPAPTASSIAMVDATAKKPVATVPAPTVAVAPPTATATATATVEPTATATATATAVAVAPTTDPAPKPPTPTPTPPTSVPDAVEDLSFDLDSFRISRDSRAVLEKVVETLKQQPKLRVQVRGHSDRLGSPEHNLELSRRRATAVEAFLIEHGVAADRISIEALGGKEPMDSNNSPVAWARNRRVQVLWR
jgi:outer membrane protein OmpA-like peptidoglycan-associated protein